VLHNDVYRGANIWNKRKQSDRWGQRACRLRPETDWIRADVPQWRIVSYEQWDTAHRRLEQAAAVYIRSTDGKRWGRPPAGVAELRPSRDTVDRKREALLADLRKLDEQQGRYVAAIAEAGDIDALDPGAGDVADTGSPAFLLEREHV
jgi:hypothetical protein